MKEYHLKPIYWTEFITGVAIGFGAAVYMGIW
jgi:hypothetical protein